MPKDRAAKGAELEEAFAEWMTSSLGYTSVTRTHRGTGNAATRGYQVDIHGKLYSPWWRALHVVGLGVWALATAAALLPNLMPGLLDTAEKTVTSVVPQAAGYGLGILGFIAVGVGIVGQRRATLHAWVECKNRQTSVKRADINKLHGDVSDVRANRGAPWKPARVMMVSGRGFDVDALAVARTHGIECWERTPNGLFRRVELD